MACAMIIRQIRIFRGSIDKAYWWYFTAGWFINHELNEFYEWLARWLFVRFVYFVVQSTKRIGGILPLDGLLTTNRTNYTNGLRDVYSSD